MGLKIKWSKVLQVLSRLLGLAGDKLEDKGLNRLPEPPGKIPPELR